MLRYFICYRDPATKRYEGDAWNAYSFAHEGDRERMIHDLKSDKSVWKNDAVQMFTFEKEMPDYLYLEESDEEENGSE